MTRPPAGVTINVMVAFRKIRSFSNRLVAAYRPERVVLFGSHARGAAGRDSDVDLLVVMATPDDPAELTADMRVRLRPDFPLDLLVRPAATIKRRISQGDSFLRSVLEEGRVLYEAPHR